MKNKRIIFIMILVVLQVAYAMVFNYILDESQRDLIHFSPMFLLWFITILECIIALSKKERSKELFKIENELQIQKELSQSLSSNNEFVLRTLPLGLLIYDDEKDITYSNDFADQLFETKLFGKKIEYVCEKLDKAISKNIDSAEFKVYDKSISAIIRKEQKTIYLFDVSKEKNAIHIFESTRPSMLNLSLDNLSDSLNNFDLKQRTELLSEYYQALEEWKKRFDIYDLSNQDTKQVMIVNKPTLDLIIKDGFSILNDIDSISKTRGVNISITIGVGTGTNDYKTLRLYAEKALELALERGGAQAVVYDGNSSSAFGGGIESQEKVSRVSTRIYANKLVNEIKNSSAVIVMPHIDTDADGMGSALGVYELCQSLKTPSKILLDLDRIDSTVSKILDTSGTEYIKLHQSLIEEDELDSFFTGKTLLILVDHHQIELSPSQKVYKKANSITIIDHHRLTTQLNVETVHQYLDHSASSSVEQVTEILSLLPLQVDIPPFIATTMLIGMLIDTNNFSSHVSDRTFESASFLMAKGADAYKAKMYLRESVKEQIERTSLLRKAEIVHDKFAIITNYSNESLPRESLAKTAEALLSIDKVVAGFAIGIIDKKKKTIGISARSDGSFNIHSEMEKFGGGGHFNMGAAQIEGSTIKDVHDMLLNNLEGTFKGEGDLMKIILVEDVKKKGKKGDIIECSSGYANYLLSKKSAIEANAANIAVLEEEKAAKEQHQKEEIEVAKKLKSLLEEKTVVVSVKTGENGKFFGSVSTKMISDELSKQFKISIDKRKISIPDEKIEALGTYDCPIKLHKEVTAILKVEVKEDKEA